MMMKEMLMKWINHCNHAARRLRLTSTSMAQELNNQLHQALFRNFLNQNQRENNQMLVSTKQVTKSNKKN